MHRNRTSPCLLGVTPFSTVVARKLWKRTYAWGPQRGSTMDPCRSLPWCNGEETVAVGSVSLSLRWQQNLAGLFVCSLESTEALIMDLQLSSLIFEDWTDWVERLLKPLHILHPPGVEVLLQFMVDTLLHNTIDASRCLSQLANGQHFAGLSFARCTFIIVETFMEFKATNFLLISNKVHFGIPVYKWDRLVKCER